MEGPKGKFVFGMVKMGEKGQIVIPKEARDMFGFKPGDMLMVIGDVKQGIAVPTKEIMAEITNAINKSTNITDLKNHKED